MGILELWLKTGRLREAEETETAADAKKSVGENAAWLITGLGNPREKYARTRHNAGFLVVDALAEAYGIRVSDARKKWRGALGEGKVGDVPVRLLKPHTFMNLSGESVRAVAEFYRTDTKRRLIVISDDVDLDVGRIRVRKKGSAGGHNGLKDIIAKLRAWRRQRKPWRRFSQTASMRR